MSRDSRPLQRSRRRARRAVVCAKSRRADFRLEPAALQRQPNSPTRLKKYLRSVIEEFPHAAAEGYHTFGWRGFYLALCALVVRGQPFPITLPVFGRVASRAEAANLIDNFALGELRCDEVEQHLRGAPTQWVVDVGVNVGVTCRWWLSLAPSLQVAGVDMFQEALDFTAAAIARTGQLNRWHPLCAAVGAHDETIDVRFSDPLEGTSSLGNSTGKLTRRMRSRTLDDVLLPLPAARIGLLKLDIEGAAGSALLGATVTRGKCDSVPVEPRSEEETRVSAAALPAAGFRLFRLHGRGMWWARG